MTYRELMIKLLRQPSEVLDQQIVMFNEADEIYYGCTGHDVATDHDKVDAETNGGSYIEAGRLFLMVNI